MVEYIYATHEDNALFFICSLVDYIARKTKGCITNKPQISPQLG